MGSPGPDFSFERAMAQPVAGIDEAGRGPWAGPVVAAAVIYQPALDRLGLRDSKKLGQAARERLFEAVMATCAVGIGEASVAEIDDLNILRANDLAMARALAALPEQPAACLIDGKRVPPGWPLPARAIIGGDDLCLSIAAASIIAKVTRDRIMRALDAEHPAYGWASNKGYGAPAHARALDALGPAPHHRRSFAPVLRAIQKHS